MNQLKPYVLPVPEYLDCATNKLYVTPVAVTSLKASVSIKVGPQPKQSTGSESGIIQSGSASVSHSNTSSDDTKDANKTGDHSTQERQQEEHKTTSDSSVSESSQVQSETNDLSNDATNGEIRQKCMSKSETSSDEVNGKEFKVEDTPQTSLETLDSPTTPSKQTNMTTSKTPSFAEQPQTEPRARSKGRRNRRRRASTPHPSSSTGTTTTETDTTTTSAQSTPEKASVRRRRRRLPKAKANGTVDEGWGITAVEGWSAEPEAVPGPMGKLRLKSNKSPESKEASPTPNPETIDPVTLVQTSMTAKPASPAEALSLKIYYPSFQTSEILEFEPDAAQAAPSQTPTSSDESKNETANPEASASDKENVEPKEDTKSKLTSKKSRKGGRYQRRQKPRRREPRHGRIAQVPVDFNQPFEGPRAEVDKLFEQYGLIFICYIRPYLQLPELIARAKKRAPEVNMKKLLKRFQACVIKDLFTEWPERTSPIRLSEIDGYFAGHDGKYNFVYDTEKEATSEFHRLCLAARWIKGPFTWDVNDWDGSLEKYNKMWTKEGKKQRNFFKEACFNEFHRLLGHIFFDVSATYQGPFRDGTLKRGEDWDLDHYQYFLKEFGVEEPPNTIDQCKEVIRCNLNVNLYDLLHWSRNYPSAPLPTRFETAQELGEYSYVNNKVFTFDFAVWSRGAKPLLGKISQFKRPRRRVRRLTRWQSGGSSEWPLTGCNPEETPAHEESS